MRDESGTGDKILSALDRKDWLSRKEAAIYLGELGYPIAPKTLSNLGSNGNAKGGPPFTQYRWRMVRYRRADLELWARNQSRRVE